MKLTQIERRTVSSFESRDRLGLFRLPGPNISLSLKIQPSTININNGNNAVRTFCHSRNHLVSRFRFLQLSSWLLTKTSFFLSPKKTESWITCTAEVNFFFREFPDIAPENQFEYQRLRNPQKMKFPIEL